MVPDRLTEPYLIVCEGKGDEQFLRHLIESRQMAGFDYAFPEPIENPDGTSSGSYGKGGFGDVLGGLTVRPELKTLRAIVIVTDNDTHPERAFRFVQAKIVESTGGYTVPEQPLALSRPSVNRPPVVVITLPWEGETGNLETLVLKAVADAFPDVWRCMEAYYDCVPAKDWDNISKQSKMRS